MSKIITNTFENVAGTKSFGIDTIDGFVNNPTGFRNKLINGGFDIWQRGNQTSPAEWSGADRWLTRNVANTGGTSSYGKHTNLDGSSYIRVENLGATSKSNYLVQRIEGLDFVGEFTVSIDRGDITGILTNFQILINRNYGTGGTPTAQDAIVTATEFVYNATTDKYEYTFTIPDLTGKTLGTNANSAYIEFWVNWIWTSEDFTMQINSIQLEEGSVATPFEQRPIGLELSLCQRYYEIGTEYIQAYGTTSQWASLQTGYAVRKRDVPTISTTLISSNNKSGDGIGNNFASGFYTSIQPAVTGMVRYEFSWRSDAEL